MIKDEISELLPSITDGDKTTQIFRAYCVMALETAHAEGKIILVKEDMVERLALNMYRHTYPLGTWCLEDKEQQKYWFDEAQAILTFLKVAK